MSLEREERGMKEGEEIMEDKRMQEACGDSRDDLGRGKKKKSHGISGSMAAKVIAFFIMTATGAIGMTLALAGIYMGIQGYYYNGLKDILVLELKGEISSFTQEIERCLEKGDLEGAGKIGENKNVGLELIFYDSRNQAQAVWKTEGEYDDEIATEVRCVFGQFYQDVTIGNHSLDQRNNYWFRVYFDWEFPHEDRFQTVARLAIGGYENRYALICLAGGCGLLCVICFIFLLCAAGHRKGRENIVPGVLTGLPLDVLTVLYAGGMWLLWQLALRLVKEVMRHWMPVVLLAGVGVVAMVLTTLYLMDFALRVKMGKFWRKSVVFAVLRVLWRVLRWCWRRVLALIKVIPMIWKAAIVFMGVCAAECIWMLLFVVWSGGAMALWVLGKAVLFLGVVYVALVCKKLLNASRALAQGQENYKVDTSKMFGEFKEHGENLNSVGQGISIIVAERMKSEHLKTELITNVSHDIKTPLTSIINYADLIWEETAAAREACEESEAAKKGPAKESVEVTDLDGGSGADGTGADFRGKEEFSARELKIKEYAEVLVRQSKRLKKLLEDLVEASKATTGNLEINLEPCEAGVLLSQAVGEYQQRMEAKGLELITRQPEKTVTVMADGRHLWRVFDNLLNNICKYAQENTRVYLSVEEKEETVQIIFRNMSKYPLDISGEELEERFVRGDRSRHMEGNGLGLSIAKSLVGLQDGRMEIVIDGDLFKVVLSFAAYKGV